MFKFWSHRSFVSSTAYSLDFLHNWISLPLAGIRAAPNIEDIYNRLLSTWSSGGSVSPDTDTILGWPKSTFVRQIFYFRVSAAQEIINLDGTKDSFDGEIGNKYRESISSLWQDQQLLRTVNNFDKLEVALPWIIQTLRMLTKYKLRSW